MNIFDMNTQEVNNFVISVFNYYNGKINVINPAELDVDFLAYRGTNAAGDFKLPDIVQVHTGTMWTIANNINEFRSLVVHTIIHELYHVDQVIDTFRLPGGDGDRKYRGFIEDNNEFMASSYVLQHQKEIHDLFGVVFNKFEINRYKRTYNELIGCTRYERVTYITHLIQMLESYMQFKKETKDSIMEAFNRLDSFFAIRVNDNFIVVKNYRILTPIMLINRFFWENVFCKDIITISISDAVEEDEDGYTYVIRIEITDAYDNMCRIVK